MIPELVLNSVPPKFHNTSNLLPVSISSKDGLCIGDYEVMPVKELVQSYEESSLERSNVQPAPGNPNASSAVVQHGYDGEDTVAHNCCANDVGVLPRQARFIRHTRSHPTKESVDPHPLSAQSSHSGITVTTTSNDSDATLNQPFIPSATLISSQSSFISLPRSSNAYTKSNDPKLSSTDGNDNLQSKAHRYPPTDFEYQYRKDCYVTSVSSDTQDIQGNITHRPVPATTVFARGAFPLSLPKLDQYLSSISPPYLGEDSDDGMFPPFDKLVKMKRSLEDLETNSVVPPTWRNPISLLNSTQNFFISLLGSSALASFYSLTGLVNTIQIFALILSTIVPAGGLNLEDSWRKVFLGTIPNILALNFAPAILESLIFLGVLMAVSSGLLYYFYRATAECDRYNCVEGLQQVESPGRKWGLIIVTFLLTVLYLPLCTMSVHVLVWSQELWAIPNPYINATIFPPVLPPLGPPNEYRDPLDFCWTTTMKRNEVNYAPIAVVLSTLVFCVFAIWFPVALRRVIRQSVPKVDRFSDIGRLRTRMALDGEYRRLLDRDVNPFAFLYQGFRRGWATYISTYLFAKLSTLVVIAVMDPDNCLFRSFSRTTIPIARQSLLLFSTLGFFVAQCIYTPFLDPVNNASEWTSRLNYLTTSITALLVTLNIPQQAKDILDSYVLYCIYVITYGLGFYFTVVTFGWAQNIVKRFTRRIDFSVDIFSPRLDTSPSSIHTKRRIWQESISVLLLTDSECAIPKKQTISFSQARDFEYPPYLLNFMGSPGERHIENLKIYREVGPIAYNKAVNLTTGPDFPMYRHLADIIQKNYLGPDSYWKKPRQTQVSGCRSHFGNAWWIPFPPTLVICYDDGPCAVLRDIADLDAYVFQNSSRDIERRRYIRMALRALDGRKVHWPYDYIEPVGSHANWLCCGHRYRAVTSTHYEYAVLTIRRRGHLKWSGLKLGSGFDINLTYPHKIKLTGEIIGLNEDYDLTAPLARFLEINRDLIDERLFIIEKAFSKYRLYLRKEFRWKARVLSYGFMTSVYDSPQDSCDLTQSHAENESDPRVQQLMQCSEPAFRSAYARLAAVSTSEAATWWYIFWDDLWRRNYQTIPGLQKHEVDFNPHYRTSIAYRPLPRAALEAFLTQRGLLNKKPRWLVCLHAGFLNKLYLRLNDAVFRDSKRAIMFHLGSDKREMDMEDIDAATQGKPSTLGTGGGTDHDDSEILMRPAYRWEGLLSDPPRKGHHTSSPRWTGKFGAWLGITPTWRTDIPSDGISLDVRLEGGRYVLLDHAQDSVDTARF